MKRVAVAAAVCFCLLTGTAPAGGTWSVNETEGTAAAIAPGDVARLLGIWQRAGVAYAIPWQVLGAINKIETDYGRNMGPSSAGAIGWMQFMPSTWERWGTDANGDGFADPWSAEDAIYSAARYLAAAGGAQDLRRAIFAYNHADWYVDEVLRLAATFADAEAEAPLTFERDTYRDALDEGEADVARAEEELDAAREEAARHAEARDGAVDDAAGAPLLTERLALQRRAVLAAFETTAAQERVDAAERRVAAAQAKLQRLRDQGPPVSVAPATSGAARYAGAFAFPVGGGPSVVSVSHTHHDYPAADIAAPEGSPVYAFADASVERVLRVPDTRCGLGLTFRTDDGVSWTYCHLSALDPSIDEGRRVAAGVSVGLVGSTGHSAGPHLHVQTNPTTVWPQQTGWFQAFAGTAFRWQDEASARTERVFAVMPEPRRSSASRSTDSPELPIETGWAAEASSTASGAGSPGSAATRSSSFSS